MRIGPFGVWEIMIILIVVLLIFGPRRLPEMAKGLGQSVRAFRKEMRDIKEDFSSDDWDEAPQRRAAKPAAAQAGRPDKAASAEPEAGQPEVREPVTVRRAADRQVDEAGVGVESEVGEDEADVRAAKPATGSEHEEPVKQRRA